MPLPCPGVAAGQDISRLPDGGARKQGLAEMRGKQEARARTQIGEQLRQILKIEGPGRPPAAAIRIAKGYGPTGHRAVKPETSAQRNSGSGLRLASMGVHPGQLDPL